jgi:hypothetical protein
MEKQIVKIVRYPLFPIDDNLCEASILHEESILCEEWINHYKNEEEKKNQRRTLYNSLTESEKQNDYLGKELEDQYKQSYFNLHTTEGWALFAEAVGDNIGQLQHRHGGYVDIIKHYLHEDPEHVFRNMFDSQINQTVKSIIFYRFRYFLENKGDVKLVEELLQKLDVAE